MFSLFLSVVQLTRSQSDSLSLCTPVDSKTVAGTHLAAFSWCCTLLELSFSAPAADQREEFVTLAAAQARLLTSVVAAQKTSLTNRAHHMFSQVTLGCRQRTGNM